jgi:hypothetical protein
MKTELLGGKIRGKIGFLRGEKETRGGKRNLQLLTIKELSYIVTTYDKCLVQIFMHTPLNRIFSIFFWVI